MAAPPAAAADDDDDEAWEPPLLSWKGIQWWSVGCRAPAICEIFVGFKTKKLSKLVSTNPKKKKAKRRKRREGEDGIRSAQAGANGDFSSPPPPFAPLHQPGHLPCCTVDEEAPKRHSSFEERCLSGCIINQLRRNSDAAIGNLRRNSHVSACNPRRNSDASAACNLQRPSTSSATSYGGYERVWALEGGNGGGVDDMLPREVKLGGRRSDASAPLGRQDSGESAHRRFSFSSFSSTSSAASSTAKLTRRRSSSSSATSGRGGEQRHLSQLLGGNQFLTHLTAAPVTANCHVTPHMRPSDGLLLDASLRCREAELKDRIIFFL